MEGDVPFHEWTSCQVHGHDFKDVEDDHGRPTGERRCGDCGETYTD